MRKRGHIILEATSERLLKEAADTIDYLIARSTIPEEVWIRLYWMKDSQSIPDEVRKSEGWKIEH